MPWEDVIGKKVKSIDEHEIGEIKSVFSSFIEVEEGFLRKDRYYIPKYYVEGYDNEEHVVTSLTKENIKEKYQTQWSTTRVRVGHTRISPEKASSR